MMDKLKAYSVVVELPITTDTLLVLATTLGQLDMILKAHYSRREEYEVQSICVLDDYDVILGKPM